MNILLWVLQVVFGLYFIAVGIIHFMIPPGLPDAMSWMYDLSDTLHLISGTAEILAGLGLILPGLFKIKTWLTPLAAAGMILVMVGASVYHIQRGEIANIGINLLNASVMAFIAYGRWKIRPLNEQS